MQLNKKSPIHLQRISVLILGACGAGSLFLPWIRISLFGYSKIENGLHGIGILVFSLFVVAALLALVGNLRQPMDPLIHGVDLVASFGSLAGIVIFFYKAHAPLQGFSEVHYGLYLGGLSALLGLTASLYLRKKGASPLSKSGHT